MWIRFSCTVQLDLGGRGALGAEALPLVTVNNMQIIYKID